jgi:hypothetical protein
MGITVLLIVFFGAAADTESFGGGFDSMISSKLVFAFFLSGNGRKIERKGEEGF